MTPQSRPTDHTADRNDSSPNYSPASSHTVLDRETVFDGAIFDVEDVSIRLHDGRVTRRQVVAKADGAIAIPITDRGTLVMVLQHRVGLLDSPAYPSCEVYEFPAGHVDPVETPAAAAERELLEETGYTAARVVPVGSTATVPSYNTEFGHRFLCVGAELTQTPAPGQFEDVRTVEVTVDDVASFIASGAIICQSTILSALFAFAHLRRLDLVAAVLGAAGVPEA